MKAQKNKHWKRNIGIAVAVITIILIGAMADLTGDFFKAKSGFSSEPPLQTPAPTPTLAPLLTATPSASVSSIATSISTSLDYINASAGAGGTVMPSGVVGFSAGNSEQFSINANAGQVISSISVDGSNSYFANYTFAQKTPVNTGDTNEKVVMVDNQRYILTNAYTYTNLTATINVYTADANWNPISLVSTSPNGDTAKDFYIMNFSSSFPDTILICGGTLSEYNYSKGIIASYNVSSGVWQWALQPNSQYLTNILNPYGDTLFIQTSTSLTNQCFY